MKRRWWLGVALAATLAIGACGGDDDDGDDGGGDAADTPTTSTTDGTKPAGDGDGDGDGKATATPGDEASPTASGGDLGDVFADASKLTYLVKYEMEYEADGTTQKGMMAYAQKPPKVLTRISMGESLGADEMIFIEDGTNSFMCTKSGAIGQCMKSAGTNGLGETFAVMDMKKLTERVKNDKNIKEVSGQKIAGRDSRCFEGKLEATDNKDAVFCVDKKDGIVTLVESEGLKMRATEIATRVDDKEFEPPFPVVG